jgi:hypothetical protein
VGKGGPVSGGLQALSFSLLPIILGANLTELVYSMELYVYETPEGNVADFRPYLDGFDHAFAEHPPLVPQDQRVEKVSNLKHPTYGYDLAGKVRFIGRAVVRWRELMLFPIAWDGEYVPVEWEEPAGHAGS